MGHPRLWHRVPPAYVLLQAARRLCWKYCSLLLLLLPLLLATGVIRRQRVSLQAFLLLLLALRLAAERLCPPLLWRLLVQVRQQARERQLLAAAHGVLQTSLLCRSGGTFVQESSDPAVAPLLLLKCRSLAIWGKGNNK